MSLLSRNLLKLTGIMLVFALLAPSAAMASPKPLSAETVHARILKRGVGNVVGVQLQSGVAFAGRVVSVDEQSFGMQLHNDPAITTVAYSDVVQLNTGVSRGVLLAIAGIGVGGVVAAAVIGFHEVNKHSQLPAIPAFQSSPGMP